MKITFLNPPAYPEKKAPDRNAGCNYGVTFMAPVHILYPAAVLEKAGYEVEFIDCPVEHKSAEWLYDFLENNPRDVFVIFTVYLSMKIDLYWSSVIRSKQEKAKVIFIGPEPSYRANEFLYRNVFVIRGEPEETILELVREFEKEKPNYSKIKSLSWTTAIGMKKGKNFHNPSRPPISDLNKIPFPARHLLKYPERYFNPKLKNRPSTVMYTSRQCRGQCIYCIPAAYTFAREIEYRQYNKAKPPLAVRSPKNIYEEFKLVKKEGYKSVAIMDDNIMGMPTKEGENRMLEICRLIRPLYMEWGCLARADQCLNLNVLLAMKRAGCKYIDLGVESFDDKVLQYVRKGINAATQEKAIETIKKAGMEPKINILLGFPQQTEKNIKDTVRTLEKLDIDFVSFGIVTPHPMTEYYKAVKANKWMTTPDWVGTDPYKNGIMNLPYLSQKKLDELIRWCYRSYYLRPRYIIKRISRLRSFGELIEDIKAAIRLFE